MKTILRAGPDDCKLIRELAVPSWEVAYADILSAEQMAYMLDMMYSGESLKRQMREGHTFFVVAVNGVPSGFISFRRQSEALYVLEKLYVVPQAQGTGAGRFLVEKAEEYICGLHPGVHLLFELNVNRNNRAVDFYHRMGFHVDREVDENIGNGFYKNDYVMQKTIG